MSKIMQRPLSELLKDDAYAGYAYAYPHKTSYRMLEPAVPLKKAWHDERRDSLFLYVHLPFCEMRCGFCNLFTTVQPPANLVRDTVAAIHRQSVLVADTVQPKRVTQVAFGGGTPSYLTCDELTALFDFIDQSWPIDWERVPISFEVSPATIDDQKLSLLRARGVDRISMGVQSFASQDLKKLGRPQSENEVQRAVSAIQAAEFPVFNVDLIYGSEGQSLATWTETIDRAIAIQPEELFLYPLYIRELTGLEQIGSEPSATRRDLYLSACDALLANGYQQRSMRLFRRNDVQFETEYCCQQDGMIGLGPGARSYTQSLHYSSEYAVGQHGVRRIIQDFNRRADEEFAIADYGVRLDLDERRRRYLIKSLLQSSGASLTDYGRWFDASLMDDFPELSELFVLDMASLEDSHLKLNANGLSWSDVIGPWLYSPEVRLRMEGFELA